MAEIYVHSSAALQKIIDDLSSLRDQFETRCNEIAIERDNLVAKWEGDASTAFDKNFEQEFQNYQTMYDVVGLYINALVGIKEHYEWAEEANTIIAEG